MAITAKFQADFSSFLGAIDKAELALVDFGKGANKVESSLNKMVDNFSGRKLIQEASLMTIAVEKAGGTAVLTAKELETVGNKANDAADKLRRLGYEVPQGLQKLADETKNATTGFESMKTVVSGLAGAFGVAFSLGAVISFGKEVLADADALQKLHDKTGISVEGLQLMRIAGDDAGVSLDSMASAVTMLQKKLGSGDAGAVAALNDLGISVEQFIKLDGAAQMAALSDAIKDIDDPLRVASDLSKLFGKAWAEQLPALKRGFKELGDGTKVMSKDAVEAIDEVGDALTRAARNAKGQAAEAFYYMFVKGWGAPAREAKAITEDIRKQIEFAAAAARKAQPDFGAMVPPKLTTQLDDVAANLDASAKKSIDFANAAKKAKDEAEKFANSVKSFSFGTFVADTSKLNAVIPDLSSHIAAMAATFADVREHMDDLEASNVSFNSATIETANGVSKLYTAFSTLPNVIPQSTAAIHDAEMATESFGDTLRDNLLNELSRLPQQLAAAFTGGGNVGGAIKSIGTGLGATVGATFGKELGGSLGKVMPGVGAVAGATLADSTTGVISNTLSGAAIGTMILPGIGTAIGAGVGALVGGLKKLFNDVEKQVNPVRQAFVDLNGGLGALNEKAHAAGMTLDAMLNAKNPEQYTAAINALNDALKFQDDAMKTLDDTVAKYGFTISELGPTFAAQKLNEQAGSLLQDYEVLTAAGVDHVAIINKMGPALQDYVNQALVSGQAIPEAMKPALQSMVDMGTLTDESGAAMTDLSKLTFAETLDKKFSSLIDTINKLADAISRGLGTAIAGIPDKTVHIGFQVDAPPELGVSDQGNYAASGGYVGANGIQYLAGGGRVLGWRSRGSDTVPAMLTPGEGVVNQRGMKTLGKAGLAALNAGGGAGGGSDMSGVEDRLDGLRADMLRVLPKMIRDAVQLAPRAAA